MDPQQIAELTALFQRIDADESGSLEKSECVKMCGGNETTAANMMKALDSDADGKVTITEWMKFFMKQAAVGSDIADLMANISARLDNDQAAPGEGAKLERRLSRETSDALETTAGFADHIKPLADLFERCDKDSSGAISPEECVRMCGGNEKMARAMLKSLDTDDNGLVSGDEWMTFFLKMFAVGGSDKVTSMIGNIDSRLSGAEAEEPSECQVLVAENIAECDDSALAARISRAFNQIDTSGNGTIELEECLQFNGDNVDQAEGMMKGLDTDADGKVSGKEWFAFFLADMPSAWDRLKVIEEKLNAVPVVLEEAVLEEAVQVAKLVAEMEMEKQVATMQVAEVACCRMLGLCNGREDFGVLGSFGWSADGSLERPL